MLRLEGAFDAAAAARMQQVVWSELWRRYEMVVDDPSTWMPTVPTGLKSSKKSSAFAPICGPTVSGALDSLFGTDRWKPPKQFGNVLVTMPSATEWRVPWRIWHSDFSPSLPHDRIVTVKLWALVDDVVPAGGGTPQIEGSHAAFSRYLLETGETDYKRAKLGFLRSHPWLHDLTRDDGDPERNARFMEEGAEVAGAHLRVVETIGAAGDVWITHPWVFHSIADNAASRPRFMRSVAVVRTARPPE